MITIPEPGQTATDTCPAWCSEHEPHGADLWHEAPAATVTTGQAQAVVRTAQRVPAAGFWCAPVVEVDAGGQLLTLDADQAVELATALLVAAGQVRAA